MPRRWNTSLLMAVVCFAVLLGGLPSAALASRASPAGAAAVMPQAPVPGTDCTVFPSDNIWTTNIS